MNIMSFYASQAATGICLSLDPWTSISQLHLLALDGEQELKTPAKALKPKITGPQSAKISQLPRDLLIRMKVDVFELLGDFVMPRPAQVLFLKPGCRSWRSPVICLFLGSSMQIRLGVRRSFRSPVSFVLLGIFSTSKLPVRSLMSPVMWSS